MSTITFDTQEYIDVLVKGGITREQAEVFARAQKQSLAQMLEQKDLASRHDLELGLARLREELRADIHKANTFLAAWLSGLIVAQGAFLVAVMAWMK